MNKPFNIFPWDSPFLPPLKDFVRKNTQSAGLPLNQAVIVFPHNRPRRYLVDMYRREAIESGKPLLLPSILTISDLFGLFAGDENRDAREAGPLDRVALLHKIVKNRMEKGDIKNLGRMEMDLFLPWGLRLADIFEECLYQLVEPQKLGNVPDVPLTAAGLLEALGELYADYKSALTEKGWTTPGFEAFKAAGSDLDLPTALLPAERVFLAGFVALAGSEEKILRRLWLEGAHVCLHTDGRIASAAGRRRPSSDDQPHWSCQDHQLWIKSWQAPTRAVKNPGSKQPRLFYFSGHDLHSQLAELPGLLHGGQSTVIALAADDLLLPVLHALPDKNVNISLGYPLERSPLCRLLEAVMRLQLTRRNDGRFHWRILRETIRHPYPHMLETAQGDPLRPALRTLENKLRSGNRFVLPEELLETTPAGKEDDTLERFFHIIGQSFAPENNHISLYALGSAVEDLCNLLFERGGDIWRRFPIDAECFFRLRQRIIPQLKDSALAAEPLSVNSAYQMLREIIKAERVPFEAEPISGVQVLGMLETRLLHFEKVILVDAVDEALPGNPPQDPLLPDALRPAVGLPPAHSRERVAAHTLNRLLAGADAVHIMWQEGKSAFSEGKKIRSRFVDEFIWQEEKKLGALLEDGTPPLKAKSIIIRPFKAPSPTLARTGLMDSRIGALMQAPMPPTMLNAYLACPASFIYAYVLNIKSPKEVNEGDDPLEVGNLIHKTLYEAYLPFLDREIKKGDITSAVLSEIFAQKLKESPLPENLPPESGIMLRMSVPYRLERFLANQPDNFRVKALEHPLKGEIQGKYGKYSLCGKIDRLDIRQDKTYILDYKTGRSIVPETSLWDDHSFWESIMRNSEKDPSPAGEGEAPEPLLLLSERLKNLQLPCYIHLAGQSSLGLAEDAVFVDLRDEGKEIFMFGENLSAASRDEARNTCIPAIFTYILAHMAAAPEFPAYKGKRCSWCEYRRFCRP